MDESKVDCKSLEEKFSKMTKALTVKSQAIKVVDAATHLAKCSARQNIKDNEKMMGKHIESFVAERRRLWREGIQMQNRILMPMQEEYKEAGREIRAYEDVRDAAANEARREAEDKQKRFDEQNRLAQAEKAEKDGNAEQAEAIISQPIPEISIPVQKEKSIRRTKTWYCEIQDIGLLLRAYATGNPAIPNLDDKEREQLAKVLGLTALAKATKGAVAIPGCAIKFREG